jgi:hypothetical protein
MTRPIARMVCIVLLSAFMGACALYIAVRPTQAINKTQTVVMREYLNAFCQRDDRHDKLFIIGQAAAMSRIVVKAGIGELALVELAKCKVGL